MSILTYEKIKKAGKYSALLAFGFSAAIVFSTAAVAVTGTILGVKVAAISGALIGQALALYAFHRASYKGRYRDNGIYDTSLHPLSKQLLLPMAAGLSIGTGLDVAQIALPPSADPQAYSAFLVFKNVFDGFVASASDATNFFKGTVPKKDPHSLSFFYAFFSLLASRYEYANGCKRGVDSWQRDKRARNKTPAALPS